MWQVWTRPGWAVSVPRSPLPSPRCQPGPRVSAPPSLPLSQAACPGEGAGWGVGGGMQVQIFGVQTPDPAAPRPLSRGQSWPFPALNSQEEGIPRAQPCPCQALWPLACPGALPLGLCPLPLPSSHLPATSQGQKHSHGKQLAGLGVLPGTEMGAAPPCCLLGWGKS